MMMLLPNAIDSDTYSAPLRAPVSARHCERWADGKHITRS